MNVKPEEIRRLVHAVTKRTGTPLHDEDLEQDIAVRALEAFRRIGTVTHPHALLNKIVRDAVRDRWRRRRFPEQLEGINPRLIAQSPDFEFNLDCRRKVELLQAALARLPETKRAVLNMFYVEDYSIPQIAKLLKKSVSAVKMELARSRRSVAKIVRNLAMKKSQ